MAGCIKILVNIQNTIFTPERLLLVNYRDRPTIMKYLILTKCVRMFKTSSTDFFQYIITYKLSCKLPLLYNCFRKIIRKTLKSNAINWAMQLILTQYEIATIHVSLPERCWKSHHTRLSTLITCSQVGSTVKPCSQAMHCTSEALTRQLKEEKLQSTHTLTITLPSWMSVLI